MPFLGKGDYNVRWLLSERTSLKTIVVVVLIAELQCQLPTSNEQLCGIHVNNHLFYASAAVSGYDYNTFSSPHALERYAAFL